MSEAELRLPTVVDLLITNAIVLTMDATFAVLADGAIAVDADRIVAIGETDDVAAQCRGRTTIDAAGQIAIPGLIDSHGHGGHTLIRGWYEGVPADTWLSTFNSFYPQHGTAEFWHADGLLAASERARAGVTTGLAYPGSTPCLDELTAIQAGAKAYRQVGIRHVAAVGPGVGPWPHVYGRPGSSGPIRLTLKDELDLTTAAITDLPTADLMTTVLPAPSNLTMDVEGAAGDEPHPDTPVVWEHMSALADKFNVPVHAHAFRGMATQTERYFPELLGPRLHLAHVTSQTLRDLEIVASAGCSVAHGPYTHANVKAPCHVLEMLEGGANVVIATDGAAPDRSFDLLGQVHPAVQLARIRDGDVRILPAGKALAMVTIDAARALGMSDEIGSLEVGKKADVVLIDARAAHLQPLSVELAPHRLVYAANGNDVSTVVVDGRIVMRDRVLHNVDLASVLDRANRESVAALERSGLSGALSWSDGFWTGTWYP
jgi:5-methylthioadenosine/S-adenosylhomocysteine deaminase